MPEPRSFAEQVHEHPHEDDHFAHYEHPDNASMALPNARIMQHLITDHGYPREEVFEQRDAHQDNPMGAYRDLHRLAHQWEAQEGINAWHPNYSAGGAYSRAAVPSPEIRQHPVPQGRDVSRPVRRAEPSRPPRPADPELHGSAVDESTFYSPSQRQIDRELEYDPVFGWRTRSALIREAPGGGVHGPYRIERQDGKFYVVNDLGERKNEKGYSSKGQARQLQKALYSQVPGAREQAEEDGHRKAASAGPEHMQEYAAGSPEAMRRHLQEGHGLAEPYLDRDERGMPLMDEIHRYHHDEDDAADADELDRYDYELEHPGGWSGFLGDVNDRRYGYGPGRTAMTTAFQRRMHEAASQLPQVQEIVSPDNVPDPQADVLPPDVMFPLDPAFEARWVTGPNGAQPQGTTTASIRRTAADWSKRHYEHLANYTSLLPPHLRNSVALTLTKHIPGLDIGRSGPDHYRQFITSATEPQERPARLRYHPGFTRGHHDVVARAIQDMGIRGMPPADVKHVAEHFAREMNGGSQAFSVPRFYDTIQKYDDVGLDSSHPLMHSQTEHASPSDNRRGPRPSAPQRALQIMLGREPQLPRDPNAPTRDAYRGGTQREEDVEYDPVFGWRRKEALARLRAQANGSRRGDTVPAASLPSGEQVGDQDGDLWGGRSEPGERAVSNAGQGAYGDHQPIASRRITADFMSKPHESTDDLQPPFNSRQTAPQQPDGDWQAGFTEGQQDRAAGEAPTFSDNSSHVSPYVGGYAAGYGGGTPASGAGPDVPASMGGDSGQSVNDQQAAQQWQTAQAARRPQRPQWIRDVEAAIRCEAATSVDLITDGPGTSPDPMGQTPLNGPGTPPPFGGGENPARPGGIPPYQGADPGPSAPVAPDDVMGHAQDPQHESGPFTQTFSGRQPGNIDLAPAAPNNASGSGYENRDAYGGDPRMRAQAFRARVQASLRAREAAGIR